MSSRTDSSDHRLAADLAARAGEMLLDLRKSGLAGRELRDAGDLRSHEMLTSALAENRPDDGVLSEEGEHAGARLERRRVWIVDPLDGTREYGEEGRDDWAVHVALSVDGALVAGAVALPARGMVLSTAEPPAPPPPPPPRPRLVVSRTRPPAFTEHLAERLGGVVVPLGSAGAKAMAVVLGDAEVYAHAGGMHEWDSAAPAAVAAAAGLHVSGIDGAPLVFNRPDPWHDDLLICAPTLAPAVIAACAEVR